MEENTLSLMDLLKRLENIENELREVRRDIAQSIVPSKAITKDTTNTSLEYTLNDLYEAFGHSKQSYAKRLRNALEQQSIKDLGQFLSLTPGQLLDLDGVGIGTLMQAHKALKKMGIRW
jgi:hypothetical protein